jgi:hypothetical protein
MDPLLEDTSPEQHSERLMRLHTRNLRRTQRTRRFYKWAWTELPAYRLGLLLGYSFAVYFGISAFVAGIPSFNIAAPEGWTDIWSAILILAGPIGLVGILKDHPRYYRIELIAAAALSFTLFTYAGTLLFLAYTEGELARAAAGAGFAWLTIAPMIRMFWLIARTVEYHKSKPLAKG